MNEQEIIAKIQTFLEAKKTREEIYGELIGEGVSVKDIEQAFRKVHTYVDPQVAASTSAPITSLPPSASPTTTTTSPTSSFAPTASTASSASAARADAIGEAASSRLTSMLLGIGALLVIAGLFSFVAANWGGMSDTVKVVVIMVLMIGFYSAGWYMREEKKRPAIGNALIFMGVMVFGAGVFLIAQIFNIRANWPDGFMIWFLGAVGVAYALDSKIFYILALAPAVIGVVGYVFMIPSMLWGSDVFITSLSLLSCTTIALFFFAARIRRTMPPELIRLF